MGVGTRIYIVGEKRVTLFDDGSFYCPCILWGRAGTCSHVMAIQKKLEVESGTVKKREALPLPPKPGPRAATVQFGQRKIRSD